MGSCLILGIAKFSVSERIVLPLLLIVSGRFKGMFLSVTRVLHKYCRRIRTSIVLREQHTCESKLGLETKVLDTKIDTGSGCI